MLTVLLRSYTLQLATLLKKGNYFSPSHPGLLQVKLVPSKMRPPQNDKILRVTKSAATSPPMPHDLKRWRSGTHAAKGRLVRILPTSLTQVHSKNSGVSLSLLSVSVAPWKTSLLILLATAWWEELPPLITTRAQLFPTTTPFLLVRKAY